MHKTPVQLGEYRGEHHFMHYPDEAKNVALPRELPPFSQITACFDFCGHHFCVWLYSLPALCGYMKYICELYMNDLICVSFHISCLQDSCRSAMMLRIVTIGLISWLCKMPRFVSIHSAQDEQLSPVWESLRALQRIFRVRTVCTCV